MANLALQYPFRYRSNLFTLVVKSFQFLAQISRGTLRVADIRVSIYIIQLPFCHLNARHQIKVFQHQKGSGVLRQIFTRPKRRLGELETQGVKRPPYVIELYISRIGTHKLSTISRRQAAASQHNKTQQENRNKQNQAA